MLPLSCPESLAVAADSPAADVLGIFVSFSPDGEFSFGMSGVRLLAAESVMVLTKAANNVVRSTEEDAKTNVG